LEEREREMATLLTRDRQTRTTTRPGPVEPGPERRGWVAVVIALVAVAAVAATMFAVFGGGGDGDVVGTRPAESEDEALERLVNEGYIPKEALDSPGSGADAAGSETLGSATDQDGSTSSGDWKDSVTSPSDTEPARKGSDERLTERFQNEGMIPQ
jgi:alkylation response protein AidB-like acyl-CoA dehydrogenase